MRARVSHAHPLPANLTKPDAKPQKTAHVWMHASHPCHACHTYEQANARLKDRTAQLDAWTNQHDQAMRFLMTCLKDVQSKIVTIERPTDDDGYAGGDVGSGDGGIGGSSSYGSNVTVLQGQLEDLDEEQRERVLGHLIERLQVWTSVGHHLRMDSGACHGMAGWGGGCAASGECSREQRCRA
eukprot:365042-Chlamydomonas_euryale.AAC.30